MPPPAIIDLSKLDLNSPIVSTEEIRRVNPQRHEFALLDAIVHIDEANQIFVGYLDISKDDWWVRGHIPGRPLFPGVLMIECAAQMASYLTHKLIKDDAFMGFGGMKDVKFRGTVTPPCRFIIAGRGKSIKKRRSVCECQGFIDDTMVFQAEIHGMRV